MTKHDLSNKNKILAGISCFLGLLLIPMGGLAAKKSAEVYAAQEEAASEEIMNDPLPEAVQPTQAIATQAQMPPSTKKTTTTHPSPPTQTPESDIVGRLATLEKEVATLKVQKTTTAGYDLVPENQRAAIVKRMQLAEKLVQDFGRAYDYRAHTVRQLEQILAGLHKQQAMIQQHTQAAPASTTN